MLRNIPSWWWPFKQRLHRCIVNQSANQATNQVVAVCGCFWLWLLVAVSGCGCLWLLLVVAVCGCFWLWLLVAVSGCGCLLLFLVVAVCDCFWLWLCVAVSGCSCWWLFLVVAVCGCFWLWPTMQIMFCGCLPHSQWHVMQSKTCVAFNAIVTSNGMCWTHKQSLKTTTCPAVSDMSGDRLHVLQQWHVTCPAHQITLC